MPQLPEFVDAGDGVAFRRPVSGDVNGLFVIHSDPAVYPFDPDRRHVDCAYTGRWLDRILADWERALGSAIGQLSSHHPGGRTHPRRCSDGERLIAGEAGVRRHEFAGSGVLNVYFRLAPAVHGRGLAGRVVNAAVDWAGRELPGTDLVIRTHRDNATAMRVARRAGFVAEGPSPDGDGLEVFRRRAGPTGDVPRAG